MRQCNTKGLIWSFRCLGQTGNRQEARAQGANLRRYRPEGEKTIVRRVCLVAAFIFAAITVPGIARAECTPVGGTVPCPTASPSPSATPSPTPSSTPSTNSQNARAGTVDLEREFFDLINSERTRRGLRALTYHAGLTEVARNHSQDMASQGRLHHNTDELGSAEFNRKMGNPEMVGENVGQGPSVDWLHSAFMDSPGHRSNIMESRYTSMGIGVVVKDDTIWVTQDFIRGGSTRTVTRSFPKVRKSATRVLAGKAAAQPFRQIIPAPPRASVAGPTLQAPIPVKPSISALKLPPIPGPIPEQPEEPLRRPLLPLAVLATLSAVGYASRRDAGAWI